MEYDVVNAIYAASVVFILFNVYKVPLSYYLIILGHLAAVFLTNDFLFPIDYMPDQWRYFWAAEAIRDTMDFMHYYLYDIRRTIGNTSNASLMFALFPIPKIQSVFSIAIINFMLYSFLFVFLYRKKILVGKAIWFYLLFPSLALYAALGLRDTLIFFFMILSIYALYKRKLLLSLLIAAPLLLIKSQNFIIYIVALIAYKGIEKGKFFTLKTFLKLLLVAVVFVAVAGVFPLAEIEAVRHAMYAEDGGDLMLYVPLAGYGDFFAQGLIGAFYMILKPLPWESGGLLQLIQSVENMFVFYIIYRIIKEQMKVKDKFINFLLIYFFIAMLIYGMVVFNFGTVARYRFTFETIFIVFSLSILHKHRKAKKQRIDIETENL